jgi:1-acyl-sn-glycerol-3-phosphate acyltransferase
MNLMRAILREFFDYNKVTIGKADSWYMLYKLTRVLKLTILWIDLTIFTVFMYALSFLPKFILNRFYPGLFRWWCWAFIYALDVDLRLHQKNDRPLPNQFLLIGNHPSAFEDIGIPALFNVRCLAKIQVRSWFLTGRISAAANTLFVERESKESRNAIAQTIIKDLEKGDSIALYPEGGCKGRRIAEFRYGAFDISIQTGIPILPVFLHYEAQDTFEWRDPQTLLHKLWHFMTAPNNRANYYVFDALDPKDFPDKKAFCEHTHQLYLQWQEKYLR